MNDELIDSRDSVVFGVVIAVAVLALSWYFVRKFFFPTPIPTMSEGAPKQPAKHKSSDTGMTKHKKKKSRIVARLGNENTPTGASGQSQGQGKTQDKKANNDKKDHQEKTSGTEGKQRDDSSEGEGGHGNKDMNASRNEKEEEEQSKTLAVSEPGRSMDSDKDGSDSNEGVKRIQDSDDEQQPGSDNILDDDQLDDQDKREIHPTADTPENEDGDDKGGQENEAEKKKNRKKKKKNKNRQDSSEVERQTEIADSGKDKQEDDDDDDDIKESFVPSPKQKGRNQRSRGGDQENEDQKGLGQNKTKSHASESDRNQSSSDKSKGNEGSGSKVNKKGNKKHESPASIDGDRPSNSSSSGSKQGGGIEKEEFFQLIETFEDPVLDVPKGKGGKSPQNTGGAGHKDGGSAKQKSKKDKQKDQSGTVRNNAPHIPGAYSVKSQPETGGRRQSNSSIEDRTSDRHGSRPQTQSSQTHSSSASASGYSGREGTQSYKRPSQAFDGSPDRRNSYQGQDNWPNNQRTAPRDMRNENTEPQGRANKMGIPLENLKRAPACLQKEIEFQTLKKLMRSFDHFVVCDIPSRICEEFGFPRHEGSKHDSFVILPFRQWGDIISLLDRPLPQSGHLFSVIRTLGQVFNQRFDALDTLFETMDQSEYHKFFNVTLPKMQHLALEMPVLFNQKPVPILKQRTNTKVTLSQHQIACLLANAFFGSLPSQRGPLPDINFLTLYSESSSRKIEKLKCIINYFHRVTAEMPTGNVTYARQFKHLPSINKIWNDSDKKLTNLYVSSEGTIEEVGTGMLEADFANKKVGGGVLRTGLVQEEIRFVLCPEMILSRLFTETLTDSEVLIMTGCERFNHYTGYSDTFTFCGDFVDTTERDELGRRYTQVVAMDAGVFRDDPWEQYKMSKVLRELNKAYCAFVVDDAHTDLPAVCTGNWGCGAFGGDTELKAIIQMVAASEAGRDVCYLTFGDSPLSEKFGHIHQILKDHDVTIKHLMSLIADYSTAISQGSKLFIFDYLEGRMNGKIQPPIVDAKKSKPNPHSQNATSTSQQNHNKQNYHNPYSQHPASTSQRDYSNKQNYQDHHSRNTTSTSQHQYNNRQNHHSDNKYKK